LQQTDTRIGKVIWLVGEDECAIGDEAFAAGGCRDHCRATCKRFDELDPRANAALDWHNRDANTSQRLSERSDSACYFDAWLSRDGRRRSRGTHEEEARFRHRMAHTWPNFVGQPFRSKPIRLVIPRAEHRDDLLTTST
jgi:hypothetical protein